jgi:hypothetical protein
MKLFDLLFNPKKANDEHRSDMMRALIKWEAEIGGDLFGSVQQGGRREFFCLDENTWVWHEEWDDQQGHHVVTTRYDVRPTGIVKSQGANNYQALTREEATNLYYAIDQYCQKILPELDRLRHLS